MSDIIRHIAPDVSPPPASSRYSHAVQAAGWLYITGQLPTDPDEVEAALPADIHAQAELCFKNLTRILKHTNYALSDVVFVRIFLADLDRDFAVFNEVYAKYFADMENLPSRTTVGVSRLGRAALVEIDMVCYKNPE